jgi:nucleoside-diphosphate-sugar epimerase
VFLSGATGAMGVQGIKALTEDTDELELIELARTSEKKKKKMGPFSAVPGLSIIWGDLTSYEDVKNCVKNTDVVLHVGAFVSPKADYHPQQAMRINYGSTVNIVNAIKELGQAEKTRLVYIGTIAETGDRMPPIHWGRVGDPIKPSVFDYYAVSKTAAERYVIESVLPYWTSLRQTGIMGSAMADIEDPIMFQNCLDNVLEYVSDRDSAALLRNLCRKERQGALDDHFWGHIFNIGGGSCCRVSAFALYKKLFGYIGITNLSCLMESQWSATRNFHGHYYLDSDKLNDILHFRSDSMEYLYEAYHQKLGHLATAAKIITKLPGGQKLMGGIIKKRFGKLARAPHGTLRCIEDNMEDHIAAFWGSKEALQAIPPLDEFKPFSDWDMVIPIDHGYDENKPETELNLHDIKEAAQFRGGECRSNDMKTGDWTGKLQFRCAFGHEFEAGPRLVLEGGHWCPVCERESWNYYERAKVDPFFAQVWRPLHDKNEKEWKYPKMFSELDV